jgi:hypothetical protein
MLGPANSDKQDGYTCLLSLLTEQGSAREVREIKAKSGAAGGR